MSQQLLFPENIITFSVELLHLRTAWGHLSLKGQSLTEKLQSLQSFNLSSLPTNNLALIPIVDKKFDSLLCFYARWLRISLTSLVCFSRVYFVKQVKKRHTQIYPVHASVWGRYVWPRFARKSTRKLWLHLTLETEQNARLVAALFSSLILSLNPNVSVLVGFYRSALMVQRSSLSSIFPSFPYRGRRQKPAWRRHG